MNVSLEDNNHIVKADVDAIYKHFKPWCILKNGGTGRTIWNYAKGTLAHPKGPDSMLNRIALSISTTEKCGPMQAVKQPENGKASATEEQKYSSF